MEDQLGVVSMVGELQGPPDGDWTYTAVRYNDVAIGVVRSNAPSVVELGPAVSVDVVTGEVVLRVGGDALSDSARFFWTLVRAMHAHAHQFRAVAQDADRATAEGDLEEALSLLREARARGVHGARVDGDFLAELNAFLANFDE